MTGRLGRSLCADSVSLAVIIPCTSGITRWTTRCGVGAEEVLP